MARATLPTSTTGPRTLQLSAGQRAGFALSENAGATISQPIFGKNRHHHYQRHRDHDYTFLSRSLIYIMGARNRRGPATHPTCSGSPFFSLRAGLPAALPGFCRGQRTRRGHRRGMLDAASFSSHEFSIARIRAARMVSIKLSKSRVDLANRSSCTTTAFPPPAGALPREGGAARRLPVRLGQPGAWARRLPSLCA